MFKEEIIKIEWNSLKDCNGFFYQGNELDSLLNCLCDPSEEIRNKTYWKLDNNVVVQGGISEVAFYILPFLQQAAINFNDKPREKLFEIIFEIINGNGEGIVICYNTIKEPFNYFIPSSKGLLEELNVAIFKYINCFFDFYIREILVNNNLKEVEICLYILLVICENSNKSVYIDQLIEKIEDLEKLKLFWKFKEDFDELLN